MPLDPEVPVAFFVVFDFEEELEPELDEEPVLVEGLVVEAPTVVTIVAIEPIAIATAIPATKRCRLAFDVEVFALRLSVTA